ncbi:MAG: AAA family ATPase, partial [Bryobacteraceae bacterium]
ETERRIRAFFRALRNAAAKNPGSPILAFMDEIDGLAGVRSDRDQRHYAEITNSLLSELDGFEDGAFLVVSATNRLSSLDPAARRRLGDLILRVPKPRRAAAASIFRTHLSLTIAYAGEAPAEEARERLIEAAVAAIYAPNGDNHVCTLTLRSGGTRKVMGKDLISGAEIKRIVAMAAGEACRRHVEFGERGLRLEDMLYGVDRFLESAGAPLTPANCHNYLELEDDVDVVKIERPPRLAVGAARLRVA